MNKIFPKNKKKLLYIFQDKNVWNVVFRNRFYGEKTEKSAGFYDW